MIVARPAALDLGILGQRILPRWVKSGAPVARTWPVARSHDLTADVVVWECTAGCFEVRYRQDEAVVIVAGEVFITDASGEERRLGVGDLGFFAAGSSCIWRVPELVRKVAVVHETLWRPLGIGLKIWKRVLSAVGITGATDLTR